jgi:hypothetical protein
LTERTTTTLLGVDRDASSISYIAGWSHAELAVLTQTASNVLNAVNTIGAGPDLDDTDNVDSAQTTAA